MTETRTPYAAGQQQPEPGDLPAIESRLAAATPVHLECQTQGDTVYVIDANEPDGLAYGSFDDFSLAVEAVRVVRRLLSRNKLFAPADLRALVTEVQRLQSLLETEQRAKWAAEQDKQHWQEEAGRVRKELDVTDILLDTRNQVLNAIPECPDHGSQCVPHALEWIEKQVAQLAEVPGVEIE